MEKPFVSIILNNYNYEAYVGEAIESVLNQTYLNYELIVVDDGSTDNSREIIEVYAKKSDKIIPIYKQNGGQTSAFNAAFSAARGDVIALLDSDDYWYPPKLERIVEKHKKYHFVQHYLSNNGKGLYRKINSNVNWHEVLMGYGYLYNHSVSSSLSFDRKLLKPFFPLIDEREMRYCADGILVMIALSLTEVGIIEEELGYYRIHGKNGFVRKNDYGEAARKILHEQHKYVNKQLDYRGFPVIPFSRYAYFNKLIDDLQQDGNLHGENRIVVYGTESSGLYMTEVLEKQGLNIWGYADSAKEKQGEDFLGKRIYSPIELCEVRDAWDVIIIASSAGEAISNTLNGLQLQENKDFFRLPI